MLPDNFYHPDYHVRRDGRLVRLDTFSADDVRLEDIIRRLSHLNRWRGDPEYPWSVASHTLLMLSAAESRHEPTYVCRAILAHDMAEAYIIDLPIDIKTRPEMAWYRELDERVSAVIRDKYAVAHPVPEVKEYDRWAAEVEFRELCSGDLSATLCTQIPPLRVRAALLTACQRYDFW